MDLAAGSYNPSVSAGTQYYAVTTLTVMAPPITSALLQSGGRARAAAPRNKSGKRDRF